MDESLCQELKCNLKNEEENGACNEILLRHMHDFNDLCHISGMR